jgi:hypothetical protein
MPTIAQTPPASKSRLWTGRILTTFAVAFLAFDGVMKLVKPPVVVKATLNWDTRRAASSVSASCCSSVLSST